MILQLAHYKAIELANMRLSERTKFQEELNNATANFERQELERKQAMNDWMDNERSRFEQREKVIFISFFLEFSFS